MMLLRTKNERELVRKIRGGPAVDLAKEIYLAAPEYMPDPKSHHGTRVKLTETERPVANESFDANIRLWFSHLSDTCPDDFVRAVQGGDAVHLAKRKYFEWRWQCSSAKTFHVA
jgi:hypothetical protein